MGSGEGNDLQVHPNCRRRGASAGPRSSAAEVETKKKKKTKVRVKSECIVFYSRAPVVKHFEPAMRTLKHETGKVAPSCPSATTRATIISSRKRFSSPKVSVPRREREGGGGCAKLTREALM